MADRQDGSRHSRDLGATATHAHCHLVGVGMKSLLFCASLVVAMPGLTAAGGAQERGEIRLTSLLSNIPSQVALGRDQSFVAVSTRDGAVSVLDLNNHARPDNALFFSPIRDEEAEKERALAVSPEGGLIAVGAPLERGKPNTARIYFFRRADNSRVIYTIDGLPSRPMALRFASDRQERRLRLAAALADGEPPRVWDVSEIRQLARDPARAIAAIEPAEILPEPTPGFFRECGRADNECHGRTAVFPPASLQTDIGLVVGSDSGLVIYRDDFDGFKALAYGSWREQPELRRVSAVSFARRRALRARQARLFARRYLGLPGSGLRRQGSARRGRRHWEAHAATQGAQAAGARPEGNAGAGVPTSVRSPGRAARYSPQAFTSACSTTAASARPSRRCCTRSSRMKPLRCCNGSFRTAAAHARSASAPIRRWTCSRLDPVASSSPRRTRSSRRTGRTARFRCFPAAPASRATSRGRSSISGTASVAT